jgi:hypothetical protein
MIAVLCTDGQMNLQHVQSECISGKWVPLLVYTIEGEEGVVIPLFHDQKTARSFIKRNLPKDWVHGGVELTDRDIDWIKDKGWKIREMNYPNKVTDLLGLKFTMEILEFAEEPGFTVGKL